ncbi:MAG: hypothetical protein JWN39_1583 [Ilumatobacteraceae bacterium]|nr:hypothetical protein [Ilumatobacteraceae bacterium]
MKFGNPDITPHTDRSPDPTASSSVLICRGCCCGTVDKHPQIDHAAHLALLRAATAATSTRLWTVDCLGTCERSNVVVVRTGARRRRFGEMLDDDDIDQLAAWMRTGASTSLPAGLATREFTTDATPLMVAEVVPLPAAALADVVHELLRDGSSWVLGVHGASGEFDGSDPDRVVTRSGPVVIATTESAALRVDIDDHARLYSLDKRGTHEPVLMILAVGDAHAFSGGNVITDLGPDTNAIRPAAHSTLFDLGIGRSATFAIQACGDVERLLRQHLGRPLDAALADINDQLVAASPTRVIETPLARIEVVAPIPASGAASPPGSYTHLLPGELDLGLVLPPGIGLPDGVTPAAIIRPPSGWTYPGVPTTEWR